MSDQFMNLRETDTGHSEAEVLFFDDFSSGELDRTKWNVRVTGSIYNDEQQAYVDSEETIYIASGEDAAGAKNNALVIHPRYRPAFTTADGKRFDFISGRIDTRDKFDFRYGSAAARMMLAPGAGLWPAFWLLGYESWPVSGEIDVLEFVGERDWVSSAAHGPNYFGEAGLGNKYYFASNEDAASWHVYSVDWSPDWLLFKVDGCLTYRVTRPMTQFFGPWVYDNHKYIILNCALGGTYPFKTNGVRKPYYGLPQSTVERLQQEEVKIFIDWVRVNRKA